jgi:colicin import membrane protein
MTLLSASWIDDHAAVQRSSFTRALTISLAGHIVLFLVVTIAPKPGPAPLPRVISVQLVQMAPAAPAETGKGTALTKARPVAKSAPKPPAPAPTPRKVVLPTQARAVPKKVRQVKRRPKPEELGYSDALAALRADLGEDESPPPESHARAETAEDSPPQTVQSGHQVSPEIAAWMTATRSHLRRVWVTPPEYLDRPLMTEVRVNLGPDGAVLGTPRVVRSSGDPYWDDNTIRALMRASPLPRPPEAGEWPFIFTPR